MDVIQGYKSNFKVVEHYYQMFAPAGETPTFRIEVLNDFKWGEDIASEVTQSAYEAIGDYIQSYEELMDWAKDRWEEGQGELDGSCPPFEFRAWLDISIECEGFSGNIELINRM